MVKDSQSGRLGGYEDSSPAPNDWHRLAKGLFILRRRGQTLSVKHLAEKKTKHKMQNSISINAFDYSNCATYIFYMSHLYRGNVVK